jgi:hypothetical protein
MDALGLELARPGALALVQRTNIITWQGHVFSNYRYYLRQRAGMVRSESDSFWSQFHFDGQGLRYEEVLSWRTSSVPIFIDDCVVNGGQSTRYAHVRLAISSDCKLVTTKLTVKPLEFWHMLIL